jgi:hypothetical protein
MHTSVFRCNLTIFPPFTKRGSIDMQHNSVPAPQRVGRLRRQSLPALWLHWRRFAERIKLSVPSEGHGVHRDVPPGAALEGAAAIPGRVQVVQEADERIGVAREEVPRVCEPRAPPPHACAAPWSGVAPTAQKTHSLPAHVSSRGSCGPANSAGSASAENGNSPTCDPWRPGQAVQSAPEPARASGTAAAFDMPSLPDDAGRRDRRAGGVLPRAVDAEPVIARLRSSADSAGRSLTVAALVECSGPHRGRLVLRLGRGGDIIASLSLETLQVEILAATVGNHTVKMVPEPEEQPPSTAPEELPVVYLDFENSTDLDRFRHILAANQ